MPAKLGKLNKNSGKKMRFKLHNGWIIMKDQLLIVAVMSLSVILAQNKLFAQDSSSLRENTALFDDSNEYWQEETEGNDIYGKVDAGTWIGRTFQRIGRMANKANSKGLDTNYVLIPEHPFIVSLVHRSISMSNEVYTPQLSFVSPSAYNPNVMETYDLGHLETKFRMKMGQRLGLGLSYRGLGANITFNLGGQTGNMFNIAFYQRRFGIEYTGQIIEGSGGTQILHSPDGKDYEYELDSRMGEGLNLKFGKLHAYYVFNSKKFSFPAVMKYSTVQRKTAGSFFADITYFYNKTDVANTLLNYLLFNSKEFSVVSNQLALGVGYGINIVPGNGKFVLHLSVVPAALITFGGKYKIKQWGDPNDDNILFNHTPIQDMIENVAVYDEKLQELYESWSDGYDNNTTLKLTLGANIALVYNINSRFVAGLTSNLSMFGSYSKNQLRTTSNIMYGNITLGYRF